MVIELRTKHQFEAKLQTAVSRIMRTWSLIKMTPEHRLSRARSSVVALLSKHPELSENKMVILGLKHLHESYPLREG
jgi:hypothetical protein